MSDLDKAIRDHLTRVIDETMERRNGLTSILPGTEMSRVLSAVQKLIDDHKPIGIYEECGHSHRGDEPGVREFDDVGLVCADGLMYEVCASCCDWNPLSGQTEHCVTEHDHHHGGVHCMVVYSISDSLGVSGEDRSEPTPAPSEPVEGDSVRIWLTPKQSIIGKYFVDEHGRARVTATDTGNLSYLVNLSGVRRRVEVVTPEGTA